jgi:hypothetical protein
MIEIKKAGMYATPEEVAQQAEKSKATILNHIKSGFLPAIKQGKIILVFDRDIMAYQKKLENMPSKGGRPTKTK